MLKSCPQKISGNKEFRYFRRKINFTRRFNGNKTVKRVSFNQVFFPHEVVFFLSFSFRTKLAKGESSSSSFSFSSFFEFFPLGFSFSSSSFLESFSHGFSFSIVALLDALFSASLVFSSSASSSLSSS